jgi:ATP-dependent protease ClpP protease subunit
MARRWIAVEEDDASVCKPCSDNDNHVYSNRADAYADYPGGVGYVLCVGAQFGNKCRGMVKKRRGSTNEMNRDKILNTNRAILAERSLLMGKLAKPAENKLAGGKEWCRFENIGTDEASIFIYSDIGYFGTTADDFVKQLNSITAPKINVHINSEGGEVFDGVAIHTAIASHPAHVTTSVDGIAASAASFIAMAGDTIRIARNATMMIHDASTLAWGNEEDMIACGKLLSKLSNNIADMYAEQAGGTVETWRTTMRAETWFTGQEAMAAGLVDEIIGEDAPAEEPPSNLLSSIMFRYANRTEAPAPEIPEHSEEECDEEIPEEDPPLDEEGEELHDAGETLLNTATDWAWRMTMAGVKL